MTDITPGKRYVRPDKKRKYTGGNSRFKKGDILFARITPSLENGKIAQYVSEEEFAFGSTEFIVFRNIEGISNQDFIYYLSFSDLIRKPAEKSMYGASGRQRVDTDIFNLIEIPNYSLKKQSILVNFLENFDNLIEIYSEQINTLKKISGLIYKEWFINLNYPGYISEKKIKTKYGEIPESWSIKKLGEVINLEYGKGLRKSDRVPGKYPVYGSSGIIDFHNEYLVNGPCIIVGRKGNVGSVYWSYENCNPIDTVYYVESNLSFYYLYYN